MKIKKNSWIFIIIIIILIIFLIFGFTTNWKFIKNSNQVKHTGGNTLPPKIKKSGKKELKSKPIYYRKIKGAYIGYCDTTPYGNICRDSDPLISTYPWVNAEDCAKKAEFKNTKIFEKYTKNGEDFCRTWVQGGNVDALTELIRSGNLNSNNGPYNSQVYKINASVQDEIKEYPNSLTYDQKLPLLYNRILKACDDTSDKIIYNNRIDIPISQFSSTNQDIMNICAKSCKKQGFKGFEYANNEQNDYGYCKCRSLNTDKCSSSSVKHRLYKFI